MTRLAVLCVLVSLATAARQQQASRVQLEAASDPCSQAVDGAEKRSSGWRRSNDCKCDTYHTVTGDNEACKPYSGKRYFPSSIKPAVCKCTQVSDQKCTTIVKGSVERESSWRKSDDCKCLSGWVVAGESNECKDYRDQRYFPNTLQPGHCQCEAVCERGAFVSVIKQPTLGLAHVALTEDAEGAAFASYSENNGCTVEFVLDCDEGFPTVETQMKCPNGVSPSSHIKSWTGKAVEEKWEVCSDSYGKVKILSDMVDLNWDTKMESGTEIEGCVQIDPARNYPELSSVKGSFDEQRQAIMDKKTEVGGCPTFKSDEDRVNRANDFPGSWSLRQIQGWQNDRAANLAHGTAFWEKTSNLFMLIWLAKATGGNRTIAFETFAQLNCMKPAPFAGGIAKWSHAEVAGAAGSPTQGRAYSTAAVDQSESCFDPTLALFLSSGTPEHTQFRQLLDEGGFDSLEKEDLPAPTFPGGPPDSNAQAPSEKDVGSVVLPLVMKGVWQVEAPKEVIAEVLPYLEVGKTCIFGKAAEDLGLVKGASVVEIRNKNAAFGKQSPRGKKLIPLLEKYPAVKKQYESTGKDPADVLLNNLGTGVLFAGLLGTTDLTWKCVHYQWRDQAHVRMYRKDKAAYLHELMRYDGAVTSFTATLGKKETLMLEGHKANLDEATRVQYTLATSNRDPTVFQDPSEFNPERSELGEQLSWNGRLKHVIARNYEGAPRFCPGYHLSMKVAMAVCDYMTSNLSA